MQVCKQLFVLLSLLFLFSCGGGGSSSGGGSNNDAGSTTVTKTFSVSLEQVDVSRSSNSESINVDVSAVNSGDLTYRETN